MRTENSKVKITLNLPINKPDCNGIVYTEEALKQAVDKLRTKLSIVYVDDENNRKCIGTTTGDTHIVDWDSENQVCRLTVDGVVFYAGADIIVNKMENGKITDFEIVSISLTI